MKKLMKSSLLLMVMAIFLFALTGCGGNKLVATKSEEDSMFGKYEEKIEIKFKNKVASEIKMTMEFESKDKAESIMSLYKLSGENTDKMEQKDKKIIMKMDVDEYAKEQNVSKDKLTKEYFKEYLEKEGYKVK